MASVEGKNETEDVEMDHNRPESEERESQSGTASDHDTPGSEERESLSGTASDHDSSITSAVERQIRQEQGKVKTLPYFTVK